MKNDALRAAIGIVLACMLDHACADNLQAHTKDGREVVLRDDGTWSFLLAEMKLQKGKKSTLEATTQFVSKHGHVAVNYDGGTWKAQEKQLSSDSELTLEHQDGDVYFVLITERVEIPLENFKAIVLTNIRAADPNARVISEQRISSNGGGEIVLNIEATVSGIPLHYRGYYWTSDTGSVQATAWTARNLLDEYSADIDALLAGVRAHKGN